MPRYRHRKLNQSWHLTVNGELSNFLTFQHRASTFQPSLHIPTKQSRLDTAVNHRAESPQIWSESPSRDLLVEVQFPWRTSQSVREESFGHIQISTSDLLIEPVGKPISHVAIYSVNHYQLSCQSITSRYYRQSSKLSASQSRCKNATDHVVIP